MKVRKSCACRSEVLTQDSYNDFLFFEMIQANKYNHNRVVVRNDHELTAISESAASAVNLKQYAIIYSGSNDLSQVVHYERPF